MVYYHNGTIYETGMRVRITSQDTWFGVNGTIVGFDEKTYAEAVALVKIDAGSKHTNGVNVYQYYIDGAAHVFMNSLQIIPKPEEKPVKVKQDYAQLKDYGVF